MIGFKKSLLQSNKNTPAEELFLGDKRGGDYNGSRKKKNIDDIKYAKMLS